ncbi:MAG: hypothetical protein IJK04_13145 [Kiritimatiellae bacterium]|nr:hypothetical protein [Kiritimatiellia bacterium]
MKNLRPLFGFAAATAVAGSVTAFLALSPIPRLVAALLLAASLAATIAGLVALRRRRHERLFIRQSIRAYAPYVLVAIVLLAGLRMWLILMPPKPTPLLRLPPGEQETRLAADITRLVKCGADGNGLKACEEIYDYYKGFTHIDVVAQPQLHAEAFAVGYAAFLKRIALASQITGQTTGPTENDAASAIADEAAAFLADDATALRLYAGHAYLQTQAESIRNEQLKALLHENQDLLDRYPEIVTREIKNPLRILRRYARVR